MTRDEIKEAVSYFKGLAIIHKNNPDYQTAYEVLNLVLNAEMPKEKIDIISKIENIVEDDKIVGQSNCPLKNRYAEGFNSCLSEVRPIVVGKDLEIKELKEFKETALKYIGQEGFDELKELHSQLQKLQGENEDKDKKIAEREDSVRKLLSENSALKEKVAGAREALAHIRDILGQPPDRISDITIRAYADIRQRVLDVTTKFLEGV